MKINKLKTISVVLVVHIGLGVASGIYGMENPWKDLEGVNDVGRAPIVDMTLEDSTPARDIPCISGDDAVAAYEHQSTSTTWSIHFVL